jgi:transcriptional regulator CtsR
MLFKNLPGRESTRIFTVIRLCFSSFKEIGRESLLIKRATDGNNIVKVSQGQSQKKGYAVFCGTIITWYGLFLGGRFLPNISQLIEDYLKKLLAESNGLIEIQRNEMAGKFNCVPAQINYVLATRFTIERGFLVESKRGGGGYIRIIRLPQNKKVELATYFCGLVGSEISQQRAEGIIKRMQEEELVTEREAALMTAAVNREVLRVGLPARDQLRALVLKAMIGTLLRNNNEREEKR